MYTYNKLIKSILKSTTLVRWSDYATAMSGLNVSVVSNDNDQCYSRSNYYSGADITLGTKFYTSAFHVDEKAKVSLVDVQSEYKKLGKIYIGVFYHELFHILYTPFEYARRKFNDISSGSFRQKASLVSNLLEDITIEGTGRYDFHSCCQYLDELITCYSMEENIKMLNEAIDNNPKEFSTLFSFLLYKLRVGNLKDIHPYSLYEDKKSFIDWGAYKCINTVNGVTRVNRQVAYALELCKLIDGEEPNKDNVENPKSNSKLDDDASKSKTASSGMGGVPIPNSSGKIENSGIRNTPQDTIEDTVEQARSPKDTNITHDDVDSACDPNKESMSMLANDEPQINIPHRAFKLNKFKNTAGNIAQYNQVVSENMLTINSVISIIRKMYSHNNTGWNRFQLKGAFDTSTACKKDNYKFFKKKDAPNQEADLVFEILVDNSGSMSGTKSTLAGKSLIVFAEALDRLHIPFRVDAFTEGDGAAITINLKDFTESYSKTKTNMTLFTEQFNVSALSTFCGNVDEANLSYVANELALTKQQDKVIIVISDGATCGSRTVLANVANSIEKRGVTVLGVGIMDYNVKDIYTNHIILKNKEDLEKLKDFLNQYLVKKIFK